MYEDGAPFAVKGHAAAARYVTDLENGMDIQQEPGIRLSAMAHNDPDRSCLVVHWRPGMTYVRLKIHTESSVDTGRITLAGCQLRPA